MNQIVFYNIPSETEDGEVWKVVEDFPDYFISNHGRVWSSKTKKLLKQSVNEHGYYIVGLYHCGHSKKCKIHRLLAEAFIPNPEGKRCINHKNGIKTDNRLENLEWVTHSENNQHAYDTGLKLRKPGFPNEVRDEIRRLWKTGRFSQKDLASMFGFSLSGIKKYVKGVESPRSYNPRNRVPEETKLEIVRLYETKRYNKTELAKMFNVSRTSVLRSVRQAKK